MMGRITKGIVIPQKTKTAANNIFDIVESGLSNANEMVRNTIKTANSIPNVDSAMSDLFKNKYLALKPLKAFFA